MSEGQKLLVSIVGPTAVGKTSFAIELAKVFQTEILSVDSRQCYREMTIGTAKPSKNELDQVDHHFIDSHSITEVVSAGVFEQLALDVLEKLFQEHEVVIAVGGSGLYFQALWGGMDQIPAIDPIIRERLNNELDIKGLDALLKELETSDPDYYKEVDQKNPQRIIRALEVIRATGEKYSFFRKSALVSRPFSNLKIGLSMERETLYDRIDQRMDEMFGLGLFQEAERLIEFRDRNALQTVGYTEIFDYLDGKYDKEEAVRLLKRNSRRYAKRQLTWFRRDPEIIWIESHEIDKVVRLVESRLGI